MCPSLTLQQIYKLTEHHHDDWITGSQTTDTLVLLQTLKRVVDSTVSPHSLMLLEVPEADCLNVQLVMIPHMLIRNLPLIRILL